MNYGNYRSTISRNFNEYTDRRKFNAKRGAVLGAGLGILAGIVLAANPETRQEHGIGMLVLATTINSAVAAGVFSAGGCIYQRVVNPTLDKIHHKLAQRYKINYPES